MKHGIPTQRRSCEVSSGRSPPSVQKKENELYANSNRYVYIQYVPENYEFRQKTKKEKPYLQSDRLFTVRILEH